MHHNSITQFNHPIQNSIQPNKTKTQIIEKSGYLIAINSENPNETAMVVQNQRDVIGIPIEHIIK